MNASHENAGQPVLIVWMEDAIIHTAEHPYCADRLCPCHDEEMEEARGYAPDGSNYHDHLCRCPGCDYDGPEPTDEEVEAIMSKRQWLSEHL